MLITIDVSVYVVLLYPLAPVSILSIHDVVLPAVFISYSNIAFCIIYSSRFSSVLNVVHYSVVFIIPFLHRDLLHVSYYFILLLTRVFTLPLFYFRPR